MKLTENLNICFAKWADVLSHSMPYLEMFNNAIGMEDVLTIGQDSDLTPVVVLI